ncbi:MAG TPA: hypothetical protein VJS12_04535 [Steroidobacteraceae bacterium]|nr:hypothetical protein [Steroidobacteraceae bacterium]
MAAAPPHPSLLVSVGIGALVAWRMYSRVRRAIGRQKFSSKRPWVTVVLFTLLFGLLMFTSLAQPMNAVALVVGAACGTALGILGLRLTRFEQTPEGLFYTPSAHLGIALSLLLFGRVAYRMYQSYTLADQASATGMNAVTNSPLTLVIFATLAGYYVTYAIGLLRWHRRVVREKGSAA